MRLIPLLVLAGCTSREGARYLVIPPMDGELDDPGAIATRYDASFTTIQDAIDAASSGDTVDVPSGTYTESLTMKSGVTVDGAGIGQTVLQGTVDFTSTTGAVLSDMSLVDPDYASGGSAYSNYGIYAYDGQITASGVELSYYDLGIFADFATALQVDASVFSGNWYGLSAENTPEVAVTNSLFTGNAAGGIAVNAGTTTSILHDTVVGNGFAGTSAYLVGGIAIGPAASSSSQEDVAANIITSNYYGLDCYSCTADWSENLIWGNTTDYVNDAYDKGDGIASDPLFADPGEDDYHITASSPCVDATTDRGVSTDFDGESRPQGSAWDLGMDEYAVSSYDLLITEVMANAATESTGEFVEIYNAGSHPVQLAGLVLSDGDQQDTITSFDGGTTVLSAGAYGVVVDSEYDGVYGIDSSVTVVTTGDTNLGNGMTTADPVTLFESDGSTIIATFSYPKDPGDGVSIEMVDLDTGDAAGNWRASACDGGSSPGAAHCFPESGDPAELVLTEIMANPVDESTGEYIEIYNPTDTEIDAGGLVLTDGDSTDTTEGYLGGSTLVPAHSHALILDSGYAYDYALPAQVTLLTTGDKQLGNGLSTSDPITLYQADGSTVIDTMSSPANYGDGVSVEKVDYAAGDDPSNWVSGGDACDRGHSPGRLNGAAGGTCAPLVINEVMSNALDEDTGEFVEIYNPGPDDAELAGLVLSDGGEDDVIGSYDGGSTVLPAGGWALVIDAEYAGEYSLDSSVVLVTTGDTTLGNGLSVKDDVTLYEADGTHVIDSYTHPLNAGNGTSVERVAWYGALDGPDNWTASTCASGSSPGADNCASTNSSGIGDSDLELVITEVMANPIDEDTGEFVEVYNAGADSVDMLYMVLWDGDALDTVFGFTDVYDTVLDPGGYAVILDSEYAGEYSIPADALLLVTDDTTVGSGLSTKDPVYLYEAGATALIDSYTFPFNPGNGTSVEKIDYAAGDVADNWAASGCTASPGQDNCQ